MSENSAPSHVTLALLACQVGGHVGKIGGQH
jgi:hypothetical protein